MCTVTSKFGQFINKFAPLFVAASFALVFLVTAFCSQAQVIDSDGAAGNWVGDPVIGKVRLVSAVTGAGDLDRLPLGLEFQLAPGWKIYWRTPGEAGLPPSLTLGLADGRELATEISWPVPMRFDAFGFDKIGRAHV